jgi:mannose-1-phosphate guanylyltransferase/mannose-6-phosphate isomerase
MNIVPVILAGGVGERFWPLSRQKKPKQLLPIVSSRAMIEETFRRARPLCSGAVRPLLVTGASMAQGIRRVLPKSIRYDCIIEPAGKNTAPAVAAAAVWIQKKYSDALMLILPADHAISPLKDFIAAVRYAAELADESECLCVFGIRPARPETGYGYIQVGDALGSASRIKAYAVRRFVEKPSAALAKSYVSLNTYFWNSGMFVWKASVILDEMRSHMPDLHHRAQALAARKLSANSINGFYRMCRKESIDYGIMEKSTRVTMVCPTFDWDDVGSWESLVRIHGQGERGNACVGSRIFDDDCADSIIVNKSGMAVAACGLKGAAIVATDDAILVIARNKLPSLRQYIAAMKSDKRLPRSIF